MRLLTRRSPTAAVLVATRQPRLGATGIAAAGADTTTTAPVVRSMRVAVVHAPPPRHAPRSRSAKPPLQATMFGATKSVATWYSQMSGGQVTVTGTVYGYYGGVRSCDLATELDAGAAAAAEDGYVASDYDQSRRVHARAVVWLRRNGVDRRERCVPRRHCASGCDRARARSQPRPDARGRVGVRLRSRDRPGA